MPYDRLIKAGRITSYSAKPEEIKQLLMVADRDLNAADHNIDAEPDWAYTMAYNAILQTSRAFLLKEGYRPRGSEQHATVVEFVREALSTKFKREIDLFDQMRRKRHQVIYESAGLIGKQQAEQAVNFAHRFVASLNEEITGQRELGIV